VTAVPSTPSSPETDTPRTDSVRPAETLELHTRLLRLALGVEESIAYWARATPPVPQAERIAQAFEHHWFGDKSEDRVRTLLAHFAARYDAFPQAIEALGKWKEMPPEVCRLVCHWHLQLSDVLYRRFSGEFLTAQRAAGAQTVDLEVALKWLTDAYPERWADATARKFAGNLLSASSEAGLLSPRKAPRTLMHPVVPDVALAYLLYLLRGVSFEGTLTENPYLISVGLTGAALDQRLQALPGITFRRTGTAAEFEWAAPDLAAWARTLK